jgi:phenylalanyl-tRNA synthetase beta chain
MKISELWLREFVSPEASGLEIAAKLTAAGLEVDAYHPVCGAFSKVIVAKVLSTNKHPEADRLNVCEVDAGKLGTLQIVCGAPNVRANLKVALALVGAELPGAIVIKDAKLRGVQSCGMLCSVEELGFKEKSQGILELPADAPIGEDLRVYLQLDDNIFDIGITPNRGDCLSVKGIARDLAAIYNLPYVAPNVIPAPVSSAKIIEAAVLEPDTCSNYCIRVISGIKQNVTTPLFISERLKRSEIKLIHPVVDITNYVMLELGQPLHAFDYAKISGKINVRYMQPAEKLLALNNAEIVCATLQSLLVIADDLKPLAVAGIIGGLDSGINDATSEILLESAHFAANTLAKTHRLYKIDTDALYRFERGVEPGLQRLALERASNLILEILGGQAGPITAIEAKFTPTIIEFNPDLVQTLTGMTVTLPRMQEVLQNLGFIVELGQVLWRVTVPASRSDVTLAVDLVEEIVRIYGYEHLIAEPSIAALRSCKVNQIYDIESQMAEFFKHRGFFEALNYSFVDARLQDLINPQHASLNLANPISAELGSMRTSLWPGLINALLYNLKRQQHCVKLFERGSVFVYEDGNTVERSCIAGVISGEFGQLNCNDSKKTFNFYDLKGELQALTANLSKASLEFRADPHMALHPGRSAALYLDGVYVGACGVLHPKIADLLDVQQEVVLFALRILPFTEKKTLQYQAISKYPLVRRDLSLLISQDFSYAQVKTALYAAVNLAWLKAIEIFDVYLGQGVPAGQKSIALSFTFQNVAATLTDAEINAVMAKIVQLLEGQFAAQLRE